jgi:hypothetical protein
LNERIIELEDIAVNDFYGPHHRNMDQVKRLKFEAVEQAA